MEALWHFNAGTLAFRRLIFTFINLRPSNTFRFGQGFKKNTGLFGLCKRTIFVLTFFFVLILWFINNLYMQKWSIFNVRNVFSKSSFYLITNSSEQKFFKYLLHEIPCTVERRRYVQTFVKLFPFSEGFFQQFQRLCKTDLIYLHSYTVLGG